MYVDQFNVYYTHVMVLHNSDSSECDCMCFTTVLRCSFRVSSNNIQLRNTLTPNTLKQSWLTCCCKYSNKGRNKMGFGHSCSSNQVLRAFLAFHVHVVISDSSHKKCDTLMLSASQSACNSDSRRRINELKFWIFCKWDGRHKVIDVAFQHYQVCGIYIVFAILKM